MEAFDYAAIDASGTRRTGTLMAASARAARDQLRARSLTPVEMRASRRRQSDTDAPSARARIRRTHITRAARQLSILIGAATPIEEALRITALQFERSRLRGVLLDVRSHVMEGARLSEALARHPKVFDPLFTAITAAGETSGQLGTVLERRADDMEAADAIRRKVLGAVIYPVLLMVVALIVTTILLTLVVPKVAEQFVVLGEELPGLTRATIAASSFLSANGPLMLIGAAILYAAFSIWKRGPGRVRWDGAKLRMPGIGRIIRNLEAARFSRTMSGLIGAGTPALRAMETARHTLSNTVMNAAVGDAASRVREGAPVSAALKATGVFPPLVVQMVLGGERAGETGMMFAKSADYLEGEFEAAIGIVLSLLEPLIIILLGGVVLLIAAAIFMPILQLNTLSF